MKKVGKCKWIVREREKLRSRDGCSHRCRWCCRRCALRRRKSNRKHKTCDLCYHRSNELGWQQRGECCGEYELARLSIEL